MRSITKAVINAHETRELVKIDTMYKMGMIENVAMALSALIRCSSKHEAKAYLMESARFYKVLHHPSFII